MDNISLLKQTRALVLRACAGLSATDLTCIPTGWKNNILWHVGHLVVTQQALCYKLSGNDMLIDDTYAIGLGKGGSPADWTTGPDWKQTCELLISLPEQLAIDHAAGLFADYQEYPTSTGVVLRNIDDAITFNNFHEGIHLGFIIALKRIIAQE